MSEQEDMFDDRPLEDPGPFPYGEDDGEDQDDRHCTHSAHGRLPTTNTYKEN